MQTVKLLTAVVLLALVGAACALPRLGSEPTPSAAVERRSAPAPAVAPAPEGARAAAEPPRAVAGQVLPPETGERLVVQTASATLLVEDVGAAVSQVRAVAVALGGYVVNAAQREERGRPAATVTIRVPAERFDAALAALRDLAIKVSSEQTSSKDVTEEFVDTDARLRNLRATESRLLDLLQQAKSVDEVLKVEQQLTVVRGQIEQLQGRLQYLQRSSQTATITLDIQPYLAGQGPATSDWNPLSILLGAWRALLTVLQLLLAAFIWAAVFAPLWLPAVALLWRWWRRRHGARAALA